jgi:TATA-box binding protein (TBP) (component of TFIID and TFIIIB)
MSLNKSMWNEYKFKDYLNVKENEIKGLPKGVSISTMCAKCKLGTKLNLNEIYTHLELNEDDILTVKVNQEKIRTILPVKEKKRRMSKRKKSSKANPFYNQITIVMRIYEGDKDVVYKENKNGENVRCLDKIKKINLKLFKNGSVQMSGVKNYKYTNRALNKLVYRLSESINGIDFVEDKNSITISDFNIYMINSNYRINIHVNRKKLFEILNKKKIKSSYEKCIRACVIVKYCPTIKNDEEKEVSLFIFEKGNIIITGARNLEHIVESYNYINNIIFEHIDEITKKDEDYESDMIFKIYEKVIKEHGFKLNIEI